MRKKQNKTGLQTKTEENTSNKRGEQRNNRNITLKDNTYGNKLYYNNGKCPELVQDILRKHGRLNLALWLAKPPAALHDRTSMQINRGTHRTEQHTNNSYQKIAGLYFNTPDERFVHIRLISDIHILLQDERV